MAENLITPGELATWTQNSLDDILDDPYAVEVMSKVSDLCRFVGGQPDWDYSSAPFDVKMVVLKVCKRTYENPDQNLSESIGPISETRLEVTALLFDLSETERATLAKYNTDGDPDNRTGVLWVQPTTGGLPSISNFRRGTIYVGDEAQVNLGDEREWMVPFLDENDVNNPIEDR